MTRIGRIGRIILTGALVVVLIVALATPGMASSGCIGP
jgi:hypothetical protein